MTRRPQESPPPAPDPLFSDPRLAALYDPLDPERGDLVAYLELAAQYGARSLLDIGCGTGTLACLAAARGLETVGLDPAAASLDVARAKPGAEKVRWVLGGVDALPDLEVDLVTMTGNVAQVFLTDAEWAATLAAANRALSPGGHLVFETRDPARRAWLDWTPERSRRVVELPRLGAVEAWEELTAAGERFVSFRSVFVFHEEGTRLSSSSTLVFRSRDEIARSLARAGFDLEEVREAPDRPGLEFVFLARKAALPGGTGPAATR